MAITYKPFEADRNIETSIKELITNEKPDIILPKQNIKPIEIEPYKPQFQFEEVKETPLGRIEFKDNTIQIGNTKDVIDQFQNAGINLRITSGLRPGAKTKQGNKSWHGEGYALDITPVEGETFEDIRTKLKNNPTLIKWLRDNKYGIIDETTPEILAKTGGTGAHWHIGKDKLALEGLEKLLLKRGGKFQEGGKLKEQRRSLYSVFRKKDDNSDTITFHDFPTQNIPASQPKQWLAEWYENPETIRKIKQANGERNLERSNFKLSRTRVYPTSKVPKAFQRDSYLPEYNVVIADENDERVQLHELNHIYRDVHNDLFKNINLDGLLKNRDKHENNSEYINYFESPTEIHSRIMEIRNHLNKKPGDQTTLKEYLELLRSPEFNQERSIELRDVYSEPKFIEILNQVAQNKLPKKVRYGQKGMKIEERNKIVYEPYTVSSGETLSSIASKQNIPYDLLINSNPELINPDKLQIGQTLNLPTKQHIKTYKEELPGIKKYNPNSIKKEEEYESPITELDVVINNPILERINRRSTEFKNSNKDFIDWSQAEVNYIESVFNNYPISLDVILNVIDSESRFNRRAGAKNSSAKGLFQFTKGTGISLLGKKAWEEYEEGTRSFEDQIEDGKKYFDYLLKKLNGDYSYGRIKVGFLAPNSSMNSRISDTIWNSSLSPKIKSKLKKGESTYKDLVDIYNSGIYN